ncbi:hypothetical protein [Flexivirga oryzae]|uniref:Uncharacterized protein n=1 Tax=Flexivirga oryzae TaxID=1794944 RepID=A0A839NIB6_9MICO|nr:hypothetical protein [Flexivirga oryzae]MBB2894401.1 hypothetical protein [Flexivirga oryzae]
MVGKLTWWAFGPVALLLCGWISWGRMFFGAAGWGVIFYPVIVVPAVVILAGPIAIAVVCSPVRPRRFAALEALVVACAGVAGFVVGLAVPDSGDAPDSTQSILTTLTVISVDASSSLAWWSAGAAVVLLIAAFTLTVVRVAGERRAAAQRPPYPPQSMPFPPPPGTSAWPPREQNPR